MRTNSTRSAVFLGLLSVGILIAGCSQSSNPVSSSNTVSSGTLQYTFATPKMLYSLGDTLVAAVTVHNVGSTPDTISVGDGNFQWWLVNSGGDTVMTGGSSTNYVRMLTILPGDTSEIYNIDRRLTSHGGSGLRSGSYSLRAIVRPMSFAISIAIQ